MRIDQQLNAALAGRYIIDREIGVGGMAVVYLAHDVRHDRPVALKVLNPELAATLGPERFLAEIRVMAHLQHPNLLPLFDSGASDGLLYYVMPFVEGESLRHRLARERQLPIADAVHIATSVAAALDYAHAQGIVHRDLKPENILLQAGEPMIADFGIALAVSRAGGERRTQSGISLGTPQYMSPEQAAGDRLLDGRSDLYVLAAVLYEMLTGEPPHTGPNTQAIVAKILGQPAPSVRVLRPSVPEHVARAIVRGLEKLPADRWTSALAFADALNSSREMPSASADSPRGTLVDRRRAVASLPYVLLALVSGVVLAAWPRAERERPVVWFDLALRDSQVPAGGIALSQDGSVITWRGASRSLYVRRLDELGARRLAGTEGGRCPSFSPDNQWIVFRSGTRLEKIKVSGGPPVVVADPVDNCGVWTDRNEILFDSRRNLMRVSAEGGSPSIVARVDSSKGIGRLQPSQALPGGRTALVSVSPSMMVDFRIGVLSLDDGQLSIFSRPSAWPHDVPQYADGYLVYAENDGLAAAPFSLRSLRTTGPPVRLLQDSIAMFSLSRTGDLAYVAVMPDTFRLLSVNLAGATRALAATTDSRGRPTWASSVLDRSQFSWPRVSPDGRRIALELSEAPFSWDVWIYDIESRTLTPLTRNFGGVRPSGWSDGGRSVVYMRLDSASLSARSTLVTQPWDGSAPPHDVMRLPTNVHDATLGAAHGYVAFTVKNPGQTMGIWLSPVDTPKASRPFVLTEANAQHPRFAPDGTTLAYTSDETGRNEIYLRRVPGPGGRSQVSVDGGTQPVWSRDGHALYFRGPKHLMRAAIAIAGELRVTRRDTLFSDTFAGHGNSTQNYDVFPDGKSLLMIGQTSHEPHLAVIRNWTATLHKQSP